MVLRRVKDLVRQKFNASIAEIGDNDVWQRAVLGLSIVGNDRRHVESQLDGRRHLVDVLAARPRRGDEALANQRQRAIDEIIHR